MMSQGMHIIVDCSGSMAEDAKCRIARHLCNYLLQEAGLHGQPAPRLFSWRGSEVLPVESGQDGVELPEPSGRNSVSALAEFLAGAQPPAWMLVSDMCFHASLLEKAPPFVSVGVGAEAELHAPLISSEVSAYQAEDIRAAWETLQALADGGRPPFPETYDELNALMRGPANQENDSWT